MFYLGNKSAYFYTPHYEKLIHHLKQLQKEKRLSFLFEHYKNNTFLFTLLINVHYWFNLLDLLPPHDHVNLLKHDGLIALVNCINNEDDLKIILDVLSPEAIKLLPSALLDMHAKTPAQLLTLLAPLSNPNIDKLCLAGKEKIISAFRSNKHIFIFLNGIPDQYRYAWIKLLSEKGIIQFSDNLETSKLITTPSITSFDIKESCLQSVDDFLLFLNLIPPDHHVELLTLIGHDALTAILPTQYQVCKLLCEISAPALAYNILTLLGNSFFHRIAQPTAVYEYLLRRCQNDAEWHLERDQLRQRLTKITSRQLHDCWSKANSEPNRSIYSQVCSLFGYRHSTKSWHCYNTAKSLTNDTDRYQTIQIYASDYTNENEPFYQALVSKFGKEFFNPSPLVTSIASQKFIV